MPRQWITIGHNAHKTLIVRHATNTNIYQLVNFQGEILGTWTRRHYAMDALMRAIASEKIPPTKYR